MLRSMTAFASAEADTGHGSLAIELRSVNHRYLELGLRLPEELRALEPAVRERVAAKLARGKVDLGLRWKPAAASAAEIAVDEALVARLADTAQMLAAKFPQLHVDFASLLGWPGVLLDQGADQESLRQAALRLLDGALDEMVAARAREGERLGGFLRERLDAIERIVADVRAHMMKDGDEFVLTQSSMQLEDLIGKFLVNGSPQKPANDASAPAQDKPAEPPKP